MTTSEVSALLNEAKDGDPIIFNKIYELLYAEIKSIASFQLSHLYAGQTISPTVLAHECYLKLMKNKNITFENKRHFLNCMTKAMRLYLIDTLRAKSSQKRKVHQVDIEITGFVGDEDVSFKLMEIDRMLDMVEQIDAKMSELLHYKLIINLSFKEIADVFQQSERQTMRQWKQAKALLIAMINSEE